MLGNWRQHEPSPLHQRNKTVHQQALTAQCLKLIYSQKAIGPYTFEDKIRYMTKNNANIKFDVESMLCAE